MNEVLAGLSVVSTICAIVFGYVAFARNGKRDVADEAKSDATVLTEIGYIKANTDEIKAEQKEQRWTKPVKSLTTISKRTTRGTLIFTVQKSCDSTTNCCGTFRTRRKTSSRFCTKSTFTKNTATHTRNMKTTAPHTRLQT